MITLLIDSENKNIVDRSEICNTLNDFFVNIGQTMDAKIPQTNETFRIPSIAKSSVYEPITCDKVVLEISQLNPKKADGPENIPNKFLNSLSPIISPYLTNVLTNVLK